MRHDSSIWHLLACRARGWVCVCVRVCGASWEGVDNLLRLHKLIQEPWESRRERSAIITCGSLLSESTSSLCVYFSLFPRGTELLEERPRAHEQCLIQTTCSTITVLFLVLKTTVTLKTKWRLHSLCLLVFLMVMVEPSFADEPTIYTQGEEPIIWLNMPLRIVVVITNRAVITGITVSLTSISWQWFVSLTQARWDQWWQR